MVGLDVLYNTDDWDYFTVTARSSFGFISCSSSYSCCSSLSLRTHGLESCERWTPNCKPPRPSQKARKDPDSQPPPPAKPKPLSRRAQAPKLQPKRRLQPTPERPLWSWVSPARPVDEFQLCKRKEGEHKGPVLVSAF